MVFLKDPKSAPSTPRAPSTCVHLVPVSEVAARLGTHESVIGELASRVGGEVRADWSGAPAVAWETAAEIVTARELESSAMADRQRRYESAVRSWEVERASVGEEVRRAETPALLAAQRAEMVEGYAGFGGAGTIGTLGPGARAQLADAVLERLRAWDAEHPKPEREDFDA